MRKKTLVVLCVCIIIASLVLFSRWVESGKVDASDKSKMVQIQDSVKYQRYREVMHKKAVFAKGRQMLLDKNVPFDPDFLIRPKGAKVLLKNYFPKMPEMQATLTVSGELQGVYMADTLYLPEKTTITGPTVILVRNLVFEGESPSIVGRGPSYVFPLVSLKRRVFDKTLNRYIYLSEACTPINHDGKKVGDIGTIGTSMGTSDPQTSKPFKADNGNCLSLQDANGRPGDTGDIGIKGADASQVAGEGGAGESATAIFGYIPDDAPPGAQCVFSAKGAQGGIGGPGGIGGTGGRGGEGGEGGDGASCCATALGVRGAGGPGGTGGKGGPGGTGGKGGPGGPGGDGALIVVSVPYNYDTNGLVMDGRAGIDGLGGEGGRAGGGGQGGDPGKNGMPGSVGNCTLQTVGYGTQGPTGDPGPRAGETGDPAQRHGVSRDPSITYRGREEFDSDEDGYSPSDGDCNDEDRDIYPGAPIEPCSLDNHGQDRNCNGKDDIEECTDPIIFNFSEPLTLTSPSNGVMFDITGTGDQRLVSWTRAGSNDGFLAIDLNSNGKIDNVNELFGSHSVPQEEKPMSNGFEALALYDQLENGGNGNGVLDSQDALYSQLLIWRDVNHNGVSDSGELLSLPSLGITRIPLVYDNQLTVDEFGNDLSIRAKYGDNNVARGGLRFIYDVYLARK